MTAVPMRNFATNINDEKAPEEPVEKAVKPKRRTSKAAKLATEELSSEPTPAKKPRQSSKDKKIDATAEATSEELS